MSCAVHCRVCGVWVVSVFLRSLCGGVSSVCPPLVVVEGGAIVDGGAPSWMVGGMVREGRLCCRPPRRMLVSPVCVLASPFRSLSGPVEWREWRACCPPVSDGVLSFALSSSPPFLPHRLCSLSQHVGSVVRLCDRVMSLWNSGDGLCGAEGRVVSTVYCLLFMCCGVRFSGVGCGMAVGVCVSLLVLLFPPSSSSSSRVGVRGSARAAMRARTLSPNTIVFPLVVSLSSLLFSAPRFSSRSAFLCLEWRRVIHHVLVCCVGMTATGSLSRSPSFFW